MEYQSSAARADSIKIASKATMSAKLCVRDEGQIWSFIC
jgi:hypothetical protein